jgi:predicted alpha/beta hydrolase family esterase
MTEAEEVSTFPTVLIVPGLRDHVEQHWQTLLAKRLPRAIAIPPMGRDDLDCQARVDAIEHAAQQVKGPIVIVAHSGGVIMVAHWARQTKRPVQAAVLVTPPDFDRPLPAGYPSLEGLRAGGWLPVPRQLLPFRSLVAASRTDPLASFSRVGELARDWGSELVDLGPVGHLNPASGFGPWPQAETLIERLAPGTIDSGMHGPHQH